MSTIFATVGVVIAAAAGFLLLYAATRPDTFRIARTTIIQASPEVLFLLINDLRRFNDWNPFADTDPTIKVTYGASSLGCGGSYDWDSTGRGGKGRMEITEVTPSRRVAMNLRFDKPMKANNTVVFTLQPRGNTGTEVSWEMIGPSTFMQKLMGVIFNIDKMVGREFARGLTALKAQAEGASARGAQ
jgi:uncharacterized protein YndB with AHSA1/START domain